MRFVNSRGAIYYLHKRITTFPRNKVSFPTYFFRKDKKEDYCEELPDGYKIIETKNNGLPLVKKI